MADYIDPNAELTHSDLGDKIELSWNGHPQQPRQVFIVDRASAEAVSQEQGYAATSADGRVLQLALSQIGERELGTKVFNRYSR